MASGTGADMTGCASTRSELSEVPMAQTSDLGATVRALRPFVPARNFDISKRFYRDLGFRSEDLDARLAEMHLGRYSFLLQDFYVAQWADNFMMHMLVEDLPAWWRHVVSLDLPARYAVESPRAPKRETWGLDVAYVFDPSGVLWHIAAAPA
jgi:hypothetical protein